MREHQLKLIDNYSKDNKRFKQEMMINNANILFQFCYAAKSACFDLTCLYFWSVPFRVEPALHKIGTCPKVACSVSDFWCLAPALPGTAPIFMWFFAGRFIICAWIVLYQHTYVDEKGAEGGDGETSCQSPVRGQQSLGYGVCKFLKNMLRCRQYEKVFEVNKAFEPLNENELLFSTKNKSVKEDVVAQNRRAAHMINVRKFLECPYEFFCVLWMPTPMSLFMFIDGGRVARAERRFAWPKLIQFQKNIAQLYVNIVLSLIAFYYFGCNGVATMPFVL